MQKEKASFQVIPNWSLIQTGMNLKTCMAVGQHANSCRRRRIVNRCFHLRHRLHRLRCCHLHRNHPKNWNLQSRWNDQMPNGGRRSLQNGFRRQRRKYPYCSVRNCRATTGDCRGGISIGLPARSKSAMPRRPRPRISACRSSSFLGLQTAGSRPLVRRKKRPLPPPFVTKCGDAVH
jgi:hypothetical protein